MGEELIEEIDWNENVIAVHKRSALKEKKFIHKVSLIIPRSNNNKFILSKRAKNKHPFPNTWVCAAGGKVSKDETFEEAAIRELKEETRANSNLEPVAKLKYASEVENAIFQIFTTKDAVDINTLNPDPEEIQFFKSFKLEEIESEVITNPDSFAPTFKAAIKEFIKNID